MITRPIVWAGTAALVTVVAGVAINQVIDHGRVQWIWLAAAVLVTLAGAAFGSRPDGRSSDSLASDPVLARRALDGLAAAVEGVWRPEQSRRRLLNPRPLPTAWTTIGPPFADHWANVRSDGVDVSLDLSGVVDLANPRAFHDTVIDKRIRGRIVLLGDPGAGKTALLIRLALTLLASRSQAVSAGNASGHNFGETIVPVPVLLRLTTWNPDKQSLQQWITTRLEEDYGYRHPIPITALMPLLDGLDEMPDHRRRQALMAISRTFIDAPLVLTSRTTEYLDAVAGLTGQTVDAAAVLELSTLPATTVSDYLQLTTARPLNWADVFTRDARENQGQVAASLAAPLWVDLARTAYTDPEQPDNDPGELLLLPSIDAVHQHLLDRLIPAAYPDPPTPGQDGRSWRRDDADRWLKLLAVEMHRRDTQDLAWWNLALKIPFPWRLTIGLACGFLVGFPIGFLAEFSDGPTPQLAVGLALGLIIGLFCGLVPPTGPSRVQIRWRRSNSAVVRRIISAVGMAAMLAPFIGIIPMLRGDFRGAIIGGAVIALAFGLTNEFTTLFQEGDADVRGAVDPLELLRGDRQRTLVSSSIAATIVGLGYGILALAGGLVFGLIFGLVGFILTFSFIVISGLFSGRTWAWLQLARLWWCARGWLPWRVITFLADAHRRGVLRQAGGVWQFRHALLRDRLATHSDEPSLSSMP